MTELEQEIDEIMNSTMKKVNTENKENHANVAKKLEQNMFTTLDPVTKSELWGLKEVAVGKENIDKEKLNIPKLCEHYIDATENAPHPEMIEALVGIMHIGTGDDIYEPLNDTTYQVRLAEQTDGIIIRCAMKATDLEHGTKYDGTVTVLASDGHISLVIRLNNGSEPMTETHKLDEYTLGKNKLTDAVYLAYTIPKFLKQYTRKLYESLVAFNNHRDENDENDD